MADRIQGALSSGVSQIEQSQVQASDVEHITKPNTDHAIPPAIASLSSPELSQLVGAQSFSSEGLRLLQPGVSPMSSPRLKACVHSVLKKVNQPAEPGQFGTREEAKMGAVLATYKANMDQIESRRTWKN